MLLVAPPASCPTPNRLAPLLGPLCCSSWRPRLPCPTPYRPAPFLNPLCCSSCRPCRQCHRCPGLGCSSAARRPCRRCCCCPRPLTAAVLQPSLHASCSPVLALPRLVPAVLSLESPLARASRSPRPGPAIPCPWRWRACRSRLRCQCHGLPCRCSSLRRPRVTLPQPSWRVTLFPSAVWNSLVVQKTDLTVVCNNEDVNDFVTSDLCCSWRFRYITSVHIRCCIYQL